MAWKIIGQIGKAKGLKGHFFVSGRDSLLSQDYSQIKVGKDLDQAVDSEIEENGVVRERSVLKVEGIEDRTAVENQRGAYIFAPDDISEHELSHLISLAVVDIEGSELGFVKEFYNFGGVDNIEIENSSGLRLLIPFVDQYFNTEDLKPTSIMLKVNQQVFEDFWTEE